MSTIERETGTQRNSVRPGGVGLRRHSTVPDCHWKIELVFEGTKTEIQRIASPHISNLRSMFCYQFGDEHRGMKEKWLR